MCDISFAFFIQVHFVKITYRSVSEFGSNIKDDSETLIAETSRQNFLLAISRPVKRKRIAYLKRNAWFDFGRTGHK